jgi:hypothetical protein
LVKSISIFFQILRKLRFLKKLKNQRKIKEKSKKNQRKIKEKINF